MRKPPPAPAPLMTLEDLKARVDRIEESYEFFLAYAAQGLTEESASSAGEQVRDYLRLYDEALDGLVDGFRAHLPGAAGHEGALSILERDVQASRALVRLVSAQPVISSQLIDNLNASIHIRALLTDLFLLGDVVK